MHKQQESLDNVLFFPVSEEPVLSLEFSGFEFSGEDETLADETVISCIPPPLVLSGFLLSYPLTYAVLSVFILNIGRYKSLSRAMGVGKMCVEEECKEKQVDL